MAAELYLDSLPAKQRAKEFKAVGKAVKNKEDAIKLEALKKIAEDPRYVTEGGCIMPLLEIMIPKKKTLEFTETAVEAFTTFLRPSPKEIVEGEEASATAPMAESSWAQSIAGLETIKTLTSNLDALKVLSDLLIYKDNVKPPKSPKVKKGEIPPPPPPPPADSQLSINLRRNSLKSVFYIAEALMNTYERETLKTMFAEIEDLTPNLCGTISRLAKLLMPPVPPPAEAREGEGEEAEPAAEAEKEPEPEVTEEEAAVKEAALAAAEEECEWALITLALLVGTSTHSCQTVLNSDAAALLPALMQLKPAFTLPLLKVLLALSKQDSDDIPGLTYVTATGVFSMLVQTTATTSEALCAAEVGEGSVCEPDDPLRLSLLHLDVLVALLSHVASMQQAYPQRISPLDVNSLDLLLPAINGAILSQKVWQVARDTSPAGFLSRCCALIGLIAEASAELRRALSFYPTSSTLLSLLKAAKDVIGDTPLPSCAASEDDTEETIALKEATITAARQWSVSALRRAAEKALLIILTVDKADLGDAGTRWETCGVNKIDLVLFESPAESEVPEKGDGEAAEGEEGQSSTPAPKALVSFPVEELGSLLEAVGEDDELADRATRILTALALGMPDSVRERLQMTPEVITKLGAVLLARATSVVQSSLQKKTLQAPAELKNEEGETDAIADSEAAGEEKAEGEEETEAEKPAAAFVPPAAGPPDLTVPSAQEVLYLGLSLIESSIAAGAEHVLSFASEEIIQALSQTVFTTGPTSVSPSAGEMKATLVDTRNMPWVPDSRPDVVGACSNAYLRPLCLDILAQIMATDEKFRVYEPAEGEEGPPSFPLPAGAEVPASTSTTEECALRVCRLAADAIIATLTTEVSFAHNASPSMEVYADPADTDAGALEPTVLKAALGATAAITSCGRAGLETALQALADTGLKASPGADDEEAAAEGDQTDSVPMPTGAARYFVSYLESITAPASASASSDAPMGEEKDGETGEGGVEEEKGEDQEPPPTVTSALAEYVWALPDTFSDSMKEGLPTGARNLLQQPVLWPFVSFLGPAVAVLRSPVFDSATARLALDVVKGACISKVYAGGTQPVCYDVFCACLVSAGGAVALAGAGGAFGSLADGADSEEASSVACQVVSRGYDSEEYWRVVNAPPAPTEGEEVEPAAEGEEPPPHTGPKEALWSSMLCLAVNDLHLKCPSSVAITSALQNALHTLSVTLVARGSDINAKDSSGCSSLMYALVMRDEEAFRALMAASPNLELTDNYGNPIAKYAFISLPEADLAALTTGKQRDDRACLGSGVFASDVFSAGADVNSADTNGNSILQLAVGLAAIDIAIGGVNLKISSAAYVDEEICSKESICSLCDQLLSSGAKVNTCNKMGMTALHVVAGRGHTELIKLFLHYHVAPCIKDTAGMLPIHYVAACCPDNFAETLGLVMKISDNRPLLHGSFDDERLKKGKAERMAYDIDVAFEEVFAESIVPACIAEQRLSREDLLAHLTADQRSLFQLLLAGHVLADGNYAPFINTSTETKAERLRAAIYLCTDFLTGEVGVTPEALSGMVSSVVGSVSASTGFNSMHAACLLLQGVSEKVSLTPAQKRSKRVRSYESAELHVLDLLASVDASATTTQTVYGASGWPIATAAEAVDEGAVGASTAWTPLHAAMWADNHPLVRRLLQQCDLALPQFASLSSSLVPAGAASEKMIQTVVSGLADASTWATQLSPSLLGAAVDKGNSLLIAALISEPKVNPNVPTGDSQQTALHMAVEIAASASTEASDDEAAGALALVKAFAGSADRLDMCVEDPYGNTCVDTAVASRSLELSMLLLSMRKNDVIERVLVSRNGGPSLLFELEEENMQKAKDAGYYVGEAVADPETPAAVEEVKEDEGGNEKEEEEVVAAEGAETAEIEVIDSTETDVAAFNPTTEADLTALQTSNALVKVLMEAVSGLVAEECHCHRSYAEGMTYSEFVQSRM